MTLALSAFLRVSQGVPLGQGKSNMIALWQLATNDTRATVETAGYFNDRVADLPKGSRITASLDVDGTCEAADYIVTANNGTAVTVANIKATALP